MKIQNPLLFSTPAYSYLQDRVCQLGGFEKGDIERKDFPDGERYQRIITSVQDRDVVVIGGTISDSDTLIIYDLACALVKYGAKTLTLIIPYFGYSTMERAVKPGEVVTAKTRARLFSSIPMTALSNRVGLLDLHSEGTQYYFEGSVKPFHLYAKKVIVEALKETVKGDFVLACTDAGRAKWVESLANELGVSPSFVFKRRIDGEKTEVIAVSADVQGKEVVIYDDMIRTGSSLLNAAQAYLKAGAKNITAITTHGVFPGNALQKIQNSGLFKKIISTDSHPRAKDLESDFLIVKTVAPVIADFILGNSI